MAVLVGIGLGAAVFASVRLAVHASLDSFTKSVDALSGRSDLIVLSPGGRVPETLISELIRHPAVQAASPLMTIYAEPDNATQGPILLIGLDPILDRSLRAWEAEIPDSAQRPAHGTSEFSNGQLEWLDLIRDPFTLIAGEKLYARLNLKRGQTLTLVHPQGKRSFRVLAKLAPKGLALVEAGLVALTDLSTFQEFTGTHGFVDRIDLKLRPSAPHDAADQLRALLPPGVILELPGEMKESGSLMVRSYQLNLSVLSFVSLFVGMFLVYSVISLNATSRRHELAILRSLGASSRIVFFLFLSEGAFFGCVGWLLAIPLSSFMVRNLLAHVSNTISHLFVRIQVDRLLVDPWEIGLSFSTTLLVSLLAAWQPAQESMRIAPREVMQPGEYRPTHPRHTRNLALCGSAMIGLVWPLSCLPGTDGVPLAGYAATFLLFAGFSLIAPWFLKALGGVFAPLLRGLAGEPAYLGGRYIRDAGTRIAISVGALITAVALFVALVIMIHSFRRTVEAWVTQSISGDLYLRPRMAATNQYRDVLPSEVVSAVKGFQASMDIIPYRRMYLHYGKIPYQFEVIDFDKFMNHSGLLLVEGDVHLAVTQVQEGKGVIVSEVFANKTGIGMGKRFQSQIGAVHLDLPVLGVIRDYRTQGGVVTYSMRHFQELSADPSWSGVRFNLPRRKGASDEDVNHLEAQVLRALNHYQYGIEVTLGRELRQRILEIFDETFAVTTVLLLIALAVATLGTSSTLTILVLDRTRQFHTILACGGTRGQIRSMVFWEALIMVFAGTLLGLLCGFYLSYLLVFVINRQSFGWTFMVAVDWMPLLIAFPFILVSALLAALPAGQMVFRLTPAMILRDQ
jgi:putative ABC transport system permease protein